MLEKFIKFAGVGVIGTAAHYTVLIALVQFASVNAVVASSAGAFCGAVTNYYLNYHFTFNSSKSHLHAASQFFVIASIGFILNGLLMALFTEVLAIHYLIAQVIATLTVLVWNFLGNHWWTFRESGKSFKGGA